MAETAALDLSVVIIARDEEIDLPGCLDSLDGLGAEIVLVDDRSGDGTAQIARSRGARVLSREFTGYAEQKQFALDHATRTWVLSLDADERVKPELARELRLRLSSPVAEAGFYVPFEVSYLGRVLRFGGVGRERHLRLFRRDRGRFVGGDIHEGVSVEGPLGRLEGKILHTPYRDLSEHLRKLDRYTTLMARRRLEQGFPALPLQLLLPPWEFLSRYVLRFGFLDGRPGFVYAAMASFYTWMKYAKLAELREARGS